MPNNKVFEQLSDTYLLALCIWAEARNQGLEGMQAVGSVILNRASRPGWWGRDIKSVVLAPKQFSCFNEDDPQRERLLAIAGQFLLALATDAQLRSCVWTAAGLLGSPIDNRPVPSGRYLTSNVGAATHYHTTEVAPNWKYDKGMAFISRIKDHLFYEEGKNEKA